MRFDPELTRRVRELIVARGARLSLPPPPELAGMERPGTPEREAVVERVSPIAEALFLVMSADGVCQEEERTAIRGAVLTITDDELNSAVINSLLDEFHASLDAQGLEARLSYVAAQLSGDRVDGAVTLELAAAVITADGEVHPSERAAMEQLAEEMGVDPDRALALLG